MGLDTKTLQCICHPQGGSSGVTPKLYDGCWPFSIEKIKQGNNFKGSFQHLNAIPVCLMFSYKETTQKTDEFCCLPVLRIRDILIVGTLTSKTSTSTTTFFKQKNSSCQTKTMNKISIFYTVFEIHTTQPRLFPSLKNDVSSQIEKSYYLKLNATRDYSHFRRTGAFESHKTSHKYQVQRFTSRGLFKYNDGWRLCQRN